MLILKANEIMWDEAGAMKQYEFNKDYPYTHIKGKNGIYSVALDDSSFDTKSRTINVKYYNYESDKFTLVADSELPLNLDFYTRKERSERVGGHITFDEDNLIIYANVLYKGKPTIQKFVIPRIDK